jgi:hypothetical protein
MTWSEGMTLDTKTFCGTLDDSILLHTLTAEAAPVVRDRLEAWYDAHEEQESGEAEATARQEGYDEAEAMYKPGADAWRDLFDAWEDNLASGRWPGADASDQHLQSVMIQDIERAGRALQLVQDIAAGKFVDAEREARDFLEEEQ